VATVTRREYWRQVRHRAWARSREHFAWTLPVISAAVVVLLGWLFQGSQAAVDNYLKPGALGVLTLVIVAVPMFVFNLFRTAADIHEEQMTAIGIIERESNKKVAALERQIEQRNNAPDPLRISFEPGVPPYEQTHTTIIGMVLGGMRPGVEVPMERRTTIFRVRVDNASNTDVENVSVRVSFDPPRRGMSNLPLQLMGDEPPDGQYRRTFTLPAFDHQYVQVVAHSTPNAVASITQTMTGVQDALPEGTYVAVITASGNGVRPHEARFNIAVQPEEGLRFEPV
jgi:hypothetical protein